MIPNLLPLNQTVVSIQELEPLRTNLPEIPNLLPLRNEITSSNKRKYTHKLKDKAFEDAWGDHKKNLKEKFEELALEYNEYLFDEENSKKLIISKIMPQIEAEFIESYEFRKILSQFITFEEKQNYKLITKKLIKKKIDSFYMDWRRKAKGKYKKIEYMDENNKKKVKLECQVNSNIRNRDKGKFKNQ